MQSFNSVRILNLQRFVFSFLPIISLITSRAVGMENPTTARAVGGTSMKGQVIGFWRTDKKILNDRPTSAVPSQPSKDLNVPEEATSTQNLVTKIRYSLLSLKGDFMVATATGTTVRYDLIKESPKFQEYLELVRQLEYVDMKEMTDDERKAFLINIYNSLVIHALVEGLLKSFPGGTLSRLQVIIYQQGLFISIIDSIKLINCMTD
jgi:hypothetical protein